ncbi:MAG: nuclear transport factor 2 family protein [Archangium sp.]|nr:nuclear transport factor 2 family protein [Archangium sp.]
MRFMSLAVAGVLCAVPAWASETENQALQRLSLEWMQAIAQKDEPALQALLAPEFSLTGAGDTTQVPRAEWIANAVKMNWSAFRYENFDVRVRGEHATVNSKLFFRVSPIPFELDSGVVDTWEKREGRWQVTGRYLGESAVQYKIRFFGGFASAVMLGALAWAAVKLKRRLAR